MAKVDEQIKAYQAFAENLGTEKERETVKKALLMEEEFNQLVDALYSFCSLRQSVDTSDTDSVSYLGRLMQKMGDVTKSSTQIEQYISKIENLDEVIGDDELLNAYSYRLQQSTKAAE